MGSDSDDEAGMIDEKEWKARAWGKKRDDFYGADVRGNKVDVGISSDEDDEAGLVPIHYHAESLYSVAILVQHQVCMYLKENKTHCLL